MNNKGPGCFMQLVIASGLFLVWKSGVPGFVVWGGWLVSVVVPHLKPVIQKWLDKRQKSPVVWIPRPGGRDQDVYLEAQRHDPWEGDDYDGTSVEGTALDDPDLV